MAVQGLAVGGEPDGDLLEGGRLPHQVGRQRPREEHRIMGGLSHSAQQGGLIQSLMFIHVQHAYRTVQIR